MKYRLPFQHKKYWCPLVGIGATLGIYLCLYYPMEICSSSNKGTNVLCNDPRYRDTQKFLKSALPKVPSVPSVDVIRIGAVICYKKEEVKEKSEKQSTSGSKENIWGMLNSVAISAYLHHIPRVEFHLFLEYGEDQPLILERVNKLQHLVKITVQFYATSESTPEAYREKMLLDNRYRCMYVRLFFPSALAQLDSILYLDTDTLVTGNLAKLWEFMGKMRNEQMVVIGRDSEPDNNHWRSVYLEYFDIPHPVSNGLNSGVILMNLTKMREFRWEEKAVRLFDDYSNLPKLKMNDQKVINMMLYYAPGIFALLPCQYNFWMAHCVSGLHCFDVGGDPDGIQLLHGAGQSFKENGAFYDVLVAYQNINLSGHITTEYLVEKLVLPLKRLYSKKHCRPVEGDKKENIRCYGIIRNLLFRSFFTPEFEYSAAYNKSISITATNGSRCS